MALSDIYDFTAKERDDFTVVCNHLLGRTFLLKTEYLPDGTAISNRYYSFLVIHIDLVKEYLSLLGWQLHQDAYNGYFFVTNELDANKLILASKPTAVVLALRLIYDENSERAGLNNDVICEVRELIDKLFVDFGVFRHKPNMIELKRMLKTFEDHCIIKRLDGKFSEPDCRFTIFPTILAAVSAEKLETLVSNLRKKEDIDEETDQDIAD